MEVRRLLPERLATGERPAEWGEAVGRTPPQKIGAGHDGPNGEGGEVPSAEHHLDRVLPLQHGQYPFPYLAGGERKHAGAGAAAQPQNREVALSGWQAESFLPGSRNGFLATEGETEAGHPRPDEEQLPERTDAGKAAVLPGDADGLAEHRGPGIDIAERESETTKRDPTNPFSLPERPEAVELQDYQQAVPGGQRAD